MVVCCETYAKQVLGIRPTDRVFSAAKLFFAYGLGATGFMPMSVGAQAVLYPHRPTPEGVFEVISRFRPTLFFGVPTLYAGMLAVKDAEKRFDTSSLRLCVSAGEALPDELFTRWRERFGVEILDGIGTTEIGYIFISNRPGRTRPGSSGVPVPGYELAIVDDEGHPVARGEIGNLRVKGDSTMAYYWNKHDKTKETLFGSWIQTGDKYYEDADGYFWYCGRSDDMLKVGGIWVSPVEVEATLVRHPAVLEARGGGPGGQRSARQAARLRRPQGAGERRRQARRRAQGLREGQDRSLQVSRAGSTSSPSCPRPRPARSSGSSCGPEGRATGVRPRAGDARPRPSARSSVAAVSRYGGAAARLESLRRTQVA